MVDFDGKRAKSYLPQSALRTLTMPVFSLPTENAVWYFLYGHSATPHQIDMHVHGLCILVGPLTTLKSSMEIDEWVYPTGPIAFMPWMKSFPGDSAPRPYFACVIEPQVVEGGDAEEEDAREQEPDCYQCAESSDCPTSTQPSAFGDDRTSAQSSAVGGDARSAEEYLQFCERSSANGPRTCSSFTDCVICMDLRAEYKWFACLHMADGPALACLRCRNGITATALAASESTKDKHQIHTMCPLCRRLSRMVRWSK